MAVLRFQKTVDHLKETLKCVEESFSSLPIESPATAHRNQLQVGGIDTWIIQTCLRAVSEQTASSGRVGSEKDHTTPAG
jgi:hypothetical protein